MPRKLGEPKQGKETPLAKNLRKILAEREMDAKALSIKANLNDTMVSKIVRGATRNPKMETLRAIADALDTSVDELLTSTIVEVPAPKSLVVSGTVAAGLWFEDDMVTDEEATEIPVIPSRYPSIPQKAWLVAGHSMDLEGITDGSYVISVDYWMVRRGIQDNDIVIVERRDGRLRERTVKKVFVRPDKVLLSPRSSSPRWQEPLEIPRDIDPHAVGAEVEIIGLVIGSYRRF